MALEVVSLTSVGHSRQHRHDLTDALAVRLDAPFIRGNRLIAFAAGIALLLSIASTATAQTLFEDDFDDNAAGWVEESLTENFGIPGASDSVFGYDYSAVGIPEAPNSGTGDAATRGVRLRTNLTGLPTDQVSIALDNLDFSGKYTVQVDMWLNWPPVEGAVGTTIHGGLYVGDAFAGDINTNTPVQRGAGFITDTDGDCGNCDYILLKNQFELDTFSEQYSVTDFGFGNQPGYDNTDVNTDPMQGDLIDLPAFFPELDIDAVTGGVQNAGSAQPEGAAGFRWVTIQAEVDPLAAGLGPAAGQTPTGVTGTTTFSLINEAGESLVIGTVDNSRPDILDDDGDGDECDTSEGSEDICNNLVAPTEGDVPVDMEGRVSLFLIDFFAGAGSDTNLSFALFDNLKVFAEADTLVGDYNNDGLVNAADYTVWRDGGPLQNETASVGTVDSEDYDAWAANYGATSSSLTSAAVPEPSACFLVAVGLVALNVRRKS